MILVILIFDLFALANSVKDLHCSVSDLEKFASIEAEWVIHLEKTASDNKVSEKARQNLNQFLYENYKNNFPGDLNHPVNSLGVLSRTTLGFKSIQQLLVDAKANGSIEASKALEISLKFPTDRNYAESCMSIMILADTYDLEPWQFVTGFNRSISYKLTWQDMLQIGHEATSKGWMDTAYAWINESAVACGDNKVCQKYTSDSLKNIVNMHDYLLENKGPIGRSHRTFKAPLNDKLRRKEKYKKFSKLEKVVKKQDPILKIPENAKNLMNNFKSTCKQARDPVFDAKLACRYQHHNNPYLKLGPVKIEEMNEWPYVVIFHELMTDYECEHIKSHAIEAGLVRSGFSNNRNHPSRLSKHRWLYGNVFKYPLTSTYKGVEDDGIFYLTSSLTVTKAPIDHKDKPELKVTDKVLYGITKRLEAASRLTIGQPFASEPYQVLNYGIAGQVTPHSDSLEYYSKGGTIQKAQSKAVHLQLGGDRIATFNGFLSDVNLHGETAFPYLGIRAMATKGSAVLWSGLYTSGYKDVLGTHGGCPVMHGSKWILTKFIYYHDQMFKHPCSREDGERFPWFKQWRDLNQGPIRSQHQETFSWLKSWRDDLDPTLGPSTYGRKMI